MKNTSFYQTLIEKGYKVYTTTDVSRGIATFTTGEEFIEFLGALNHKIVFAFPSFLDESNIVDDEMFDIEGVPSIKMKKIFSLEAKRHNEIVKGFFEKPYKVQYFVASGYIYSFEDNLLPEGFEIKPSEFVDKVMEEWEGTKEYEELVLKHEDIPFLTNQQTRRSWMDANRNLVFKKLFPDIEDDFFDRYGVKKDGIAFITTVFAKYKLIQKQEAERQKQEEKAEKEKQRKLEKELKEQQKKEKSTKK